MTKSELAGRTMLVTGANSGIGRVTAEELASRGAHVVLAGRSEGKTRPVLDAIVEAGGSAEFLALDLADLGSVQAAAESYLASEKPLHVLVNNAGVAGRGGSTVQGFEQMFGVNHLGTFLFTELLLPRLRASTPARVVVVASKAHRQVRRVDWEAVQKPTASTTGMAEYAFSKLCNVLYASELAARVHDGSVTTYSLHPGVVATDVWRDIPRPFSSLMKLFMISNEEGARTSLYCATDPRVANESGLYYDRSAVRVPSALARDSRLAQELVARSRDWVAAYL